MHYHFNEDVLFFFFSTFLFLFSCQFDKLMLGAVPSKSFVFSTCLHLY